MLANFQHPPGAEARSFMASSDPVKKVSSFESFFALRVA
jgi:hypothetical protein